MNMQSNIKFLVNNKIYTSFLTCTVNRAMDALAGSFSLEVMGNGEESHIKVNDTCELKVDNKTLITGYVDDINVNLSATSHTIRISGRDKTADLIDCSAIHNPSQWQNVSFAHLASELLKPFDIKATITEQLEPFEKFKIEQGETVFEALERMCRLRKVFCTSTVLGDVLIEKKSSSFATVALKEGVNILNASASFTGKDMFSHYELKGQGAQKEACKNISKDAKIPRYRPLLIIAEDTLTDATANSRLLFEKDIRRARSSTVNISVQGFKEYENGKIWEPNRLVFVESPTLGMATELLIVAVEYSFSSAGSICNLTLQHKEAL